MLVLSRKSGESILINDNIEVRIVEITNDKVKIGINAPKEVKIIRSELKDARQTNEQAAHASGSAIADLLKEHKQEDK